MKIFNWKKDNATPASVPYLVERLNADMNYCGFSPEIQKGFLFSLLFKSGIPEDLLKTMLSQLKKPYYYSFDCIYWDFSSARWRYFIQQNHIEQLPNEDARFEDYPDRRQRDDRDRETTFYQYNRIYRVKSCPTDVPSFQIIPDNDLNNVDKNQKPRILEDGDRIIFKI